MASRKTMEKRALELAEKNRAKARREATLNVPQQARDAAKAQILSEELRRIHGIGR